MSPRRGIIFCRLKKEGKESAPRVGQYLGGRTRLNDTARLHDHEFGGQRQRFGGVVGNVKKGDVQPLG